MIIRNFLEQFFSQAEVPSLVYIFRMGREWEELDKSPIF